ncbi:hypothetical protein GCM10009789_60900 [Kribbella sancticallisti]|uniref:Peptidase inhibitor family I36 n=1 Tax=Kribbella sancticallisti TaxID=460087 RepID=A0ABN2E827_9ACTN
MFRHRKILAAAGVLASVFTAVATAPAAQARAVEPTAESTAKVTQTRTADGSVLIGVTGGSASSTRTTAAVPSTSPAVERVFVSGSQTTPCNPGYACAAVPYGSGAYIFKFVRYDGYSVSNWTGYGYFLNNQTGGAAARYDNVSGGQLGCVSAGILRTGINWDPVWRVRLTAAAC